MSPEQTEFPEDFISDVEHFIGLFSEFHEAMPDENQHVFRQVIKQIRETKSVRETYLKGKTGLEPVWTFEKRGVKVTKRIFHPGRGEHLTGADFFLYKRRTPEIVRATAVQAKRNRGRNYFEFDQRDLDQLNRFSQSWRSAYYLLVDETVTPPSDCFLTVYELRRLIARKRKVPPIRVPNSEARKYCRGSKLFYDGFYRCQRGSKYSEKELVTVALDYTRLTKRVLVELWAQKRKRRWNMHTSKLKERL